MSCPICHKPTTETFRPFCSQHCADVDLGRWFRGNYSVPSFRQDNDPADTAEMEQALRDAQDEHEGGRKNGHRTGPGQTPRGR